MQSKQHANCTSESMTTMYSKCLFKTATVLMIVFIKILTKTVKTSINHKH